MAGKRIEFSFSTLQSILLGIGGIVILSISFVIGFMVGRGIKIIPMVEGEVKNHVVKMKIEQIPPIQAAPLNGAKPAATDNVISKPVITFYDTLAKHGEKGKEPNEVKPSDAATKETNTDTQSKRLYTIQVGAMKDKSLADLLASKLKKNGYSAYIAPSESHGKGSLYKVRLGSFSNRGDAQKEAVKIKKNEGLPATVVEK